MCQCNQTLNLLTRQEYFKFETNIANDQLILSNLFTAPNTLTLIRSNNLTIPTLLFTMAKGPIDLLGIQIGDKNTKFNAYLTYKLATGYGSTTVGPIPSTNGVINQCFLQVYSIQLELFGLPIDTSKQTLQVNLTTCEHTLRTSFSN